MNNKQKIQYTIRGVSGKLDRVLRERAVQHHASLNEEALRALERGVGMSDERISHDDLDRFVGTWVEDPVFDEAVKAFDQIDDKLWS